MEITWFKHDVNAIQDMEMSAFLEKYKEAGYGIYWHTVEWLHKKGGKLKLNPNTFSAIAKNICSSSEKVEKIIRGAIDFELFKIEDDFFYSNRVQRNINDFLETKQLKSKAGKASAASRQQLMDAGSKALQQDSTPVQEIRIDKKEEKDKKEEREEALAPIFPNQGAYRIPLVPNLEDVKHRFKRSGGTDEMAESFFNKWEATGWCKNGAAITNWGAMVNGFIANWHGNENPTEKRGMVN